MAAEGGINVTCDQCHATKTIREVQRDGSRWIRIQAYSHSPNRIIGRRSLVGTDFCSDSCAALYAELLLTFAKK